MLFLYHAFFLSLSLLLKIRFFDGVKVVDIKIRVPAWRQFLLAGCPVPTSPNILGEAHLNLSASYLSLSLFFFKYTTYTAQPLRKLCEHVKKRGVCVDESESRGLWYADVAIINSDEIGRLGRLAKLRLIWLTL